MHVKNTSLELSSSAFDLFHVDEMKISKKSDCLVTYCDVIYDRLFSFHLPHENQIQYQTESSFGQLKKKKN